MGSELTRGLLAETDLGVREGREEGDFFCGGVGEGGAMVSSEELS